MKPFDLQAALAGQPVITRDGREVVFIARDPLAEGRARVVFRLAGSGLYFPAREDGTQTDKPGYKSDVDLFMSTKKRVVWVNLYHSGVATWHDGEYAANQAWLTHKGARFGGKAHSIEFED